MLSLSQKQIILGGLLGDASLNKQNVQFSQGIKQEEYLLWKSYFYDKEPKYTYNKFNGKLFKRCYFCYHIKNEDIVFYSLNLFYISLMEFHIHIYISQILVFLIP